MLRLVQEGPGPRPFDVATRHLIETDPEGWLAWVGLPVDGPVGSIDSEVSTVLAEVDKVLRVEGPAPWIAHLELQASRDRLLPLRLLQYNALLLRRHVQPVVSTVVLLRPDADGPELSGQFEQRGPSGDLTVTFTYQVVRLWERPVDELLNGGIGVLPLAPLAVVEADRLPEVIDRLDERLRREATPAAASELWAATLLLLGLRYDDDEIHAWVQRMSWVRESSAYRVFAEEGRAQGREEGREAGREQGRVDEARRFLLRLGTRKLGPPDESTVARLAVIGDPDVLERLGDNLLTATSWEDLLPPDHD
jgi:predicted transposase YdaD